MIIRSLILKCLRPIAESMGHMHLPFTHKAVHAGHVYSAQMALKPGAVLVTLKKGEITNLLIPGQFKHAAIFRGGSYATVIEAIGAGVVETDIYDFMMTKDVVVILEPRFANPDEMQKAARHAFNLVGLPYDYQFSPSNRAFYCAELIQECYSKAIFPREAVFTKRMTLGVPTVVPQDFVNAIEKWVIVWDSRTADIHGV